MVHCHDLLGTLALAAVGIAPVYAGDGAERVDDVRIAVAEMMADLRTRAVDLGLRRAFIEAVISPVAETPTVMLDVGESDLTFNRDEAEDPLRHAFDEVDQIYLRNVSRPNLVTTQLQHLHDGLRLSDGALNWMFPGGRLMLNAHFARGWAGDPIARTEILDPAVYSPATDKAQLSLTLQAQFPF